MINRSSFLLSGGTAVAALTVALVSASSRTEDWKLSGPFGGTATTVAVDPKNPTTVLAGGMSSLLFESDNAGQNWQLLDLPKRVLSEVTSILVDPANSDHYLVGMIAASEAGLFESFDHGKTWKSSKDISDFGVRALATAASEPARFVAGTQRGVWLSLNSGKNWTRISDPQNLEMQGITAVAIDPNNPDIIYAGTSHLPWRTQDGGKTWESIHDGMIDDSDVFSIYVDPQHPSKVFASACSGIYSSDDRGGLWHKLLGIPNTSRRTHVVRFEPGTCCGDPGVPGAVYAGTTTGLFRSLNDGKTWKTLTNAQVNSLAFDPAQPKHVFLALEHEGVGSSQNGGESINLINEGFIDRVISSLTLSGNKLVAVEPQNGASSGIFVSSDEGDSWSQMRDPKGLAGVHLSAITGAPSEDRLLLASTTSQLYKSIDGGATWKAIPIRLYTPPPPEAQKPATPGPKKKTARTRVARTVKPKPEIHDIYPASIAGLYAIKNGSKDQIFAATEMGLLQTEDMGERWTLSPLPAGSSVTGLYFAHNFDGMLIARAAASLYSTKDYGQHWTAMPFPLPSSEVYDVAIPNDPSCPLLVATRVGLYSSSDGENWFANQGGIPASTVSAVLYKSGTTAYAVEYGQLYESSDAGKTWKTTPSTLRTTRIRRLWMPGLKSDRLYGITGELGIIFRN
jgi:photosystem II stability/assembly factor-like uncharacterized protein